MTTSDSVPSSRTRTVSVSEAISGPLIALLKGVIDRDQHPQLWQTFLDHQAAIRDYFDVIGLQVYLDESEGYVFLRQKLADDADDCETPRLIARRPLGYVDSLLCVLLRRKLAEHDTKGGDPRLILARAQIVDSLRVFLPASNNEVRLLDQIDIHVGRMVEFGFLRRLKGDTNNFEVRRLIKALVDASWLNDMDAKMKEYKEYADKSL